MAEQPVIVQKIAWSELCPWTLIFKTLPVAASLSVMTFAFLGVVLTPLGWFLSESVFINDDLRAANPALAIVAENNRSPYRGVFLATENDVEQVSFMGANLSGLQSVFRQFVRPFESLFSRNWGLRGFLYFLVGCVWTVAVWSFSGLAITRVCLLRLTRNEHAYLGDILRFAKDKWLTTVGAIGIPLIAVAVLCLPTFVFGLLMGFNLGVLLAGFLWFIVLAIATAIGILLLGLMFSWPLMVSSVGCESQNSFDAMTRAYAYTVQKPLNYALYMLVAILYGGFCWMIIAGLTNGIVDLSYWSTSWGANTVSSQRIDEIQGLTPIVMVDGVTVNEASTLVGGRNMIEFWQQLFKTLAAAFLYGLFWCMASAIYLLLRRDIDETEMDEIFVAEEKRTYDLPPLQSDEHGIPQIRDPVPVSEPEHEPTPAPENSDGEANSTDSDTSPYN